MTPQQSADRPLDFSTRAIREGQGFDPTTGSVIPPVYFTTTFVQDGIGGFRNGYEYARGGNPTRTSLETLIAALEGGERGFSFASGLAAEDTLLRAILAPGDHVLMGNDVYGGSHRLVSRAFIPWGVSLSTVEMGDLDAVRAAIRPDATKVVWLETPSNPLMKITDIAAVTEIAHAVGAIVVVDNTFASPYLQQPLSFGADVVVHSTTKYLGGHSDVLGGAVVLNSSTEVRGESLAERVAFLQFGVGAVSGPMDAWLTARGIKTLAVRMDRHSSNAQTIAERLVGHPKLERVYYPGLRAAGRRAYRQAVRGVDDPVPARRVARRRRVTGLLPGGDDARIRQGHAARGPGERCAPLGRHRGRRGSARRPARGARPVVARRLNCRTALSGRGASLALTP